MVRLAISTAEPTFVIYNSWTCFTEYDFIAIIVLLQIGTGLFNNVYGRNGSYVTAGKQDYAERMNQIQTQKEVY